MTNEEKELIKECRIMIVGKGEFILYVKEELSKFGIGNTYNLSDAEEVLNSETGIIIEFAEDRFYKACEMTDTPVIYSFEFIDGAGAIVLFPEDDRDFLSKHNIRLWAAEYMAGYCAFWNVEGCDWLHNVLPAIKENRTSDAALKTAAHMCARIAVNIAVGRDVKRYPRFYLCRNL